MKSIFKDKINFTNLSINISQLFQRLIWSFTKQVYSRKDKKVQELVEQKNVGYNSVHYIGLIDATKIGLMGILNIHP